MTDCERKKRVKHTRIQPGQVAGQYRSNEKGSILHVVLMTSFRTFGFRV
jgi:hypothetical protein